MDFDIGNILYVVITLVAIIASLLGKKKKKPAGKNAKPGFFENLEQVLKMGQEDPAVTELHPNEADLEEEDDFFDFDRKRENQVPEAVVLPKSEEPFDRRPVHEDMATKMSPSEYEDTESPLEVMDLEEYDEPDYFKIMSNFDAGTAVVYSAIINRVNY